MGDGVRHAGWHSRVGPAAYPIATLQKDELRKARPGGGMHLSVARAAVTIRPLSSPPSSAKVGQIELGARLGKVCARTSCFGFLRKGPQADFRSPRAPRPGFREDPRRSG